MELLSEAFYYSAIDIFAGTMLEVLSKNVPCFVFDVECKSDHLMPYVKKETESWETPFPFDDLRASASLEAHDPVAELARVAVVGFSRDQTQTGQS